MFTFPTKFTIISAAFYYPTFVSAEEKSIPILLVPDVSRSEPDKVKVISFAFLKAEIYL